MHRHTVLIIRKRMIEWLLIIKEKIFRKESVREDRGMMVEYILNTENMWFMVKRLPVSYTHLDVYKRQEE